MTDEQFTALNDQLTALGSRFESGLAATNESISRVHSSVADARHDIRGLDEKLVRIQGALYYLAVKALHPTESEAFRSMLPDPPQRLSSLVR